MIRDMNQLCLSHDVLLLVLDTLRFDVAKEECQADNERDNDFHEDNDATCGATVASPILANLRFALTFLFLFYCHDTLPLEFGTATTQVWPLSSGISLPAASVNVIGSVRLFFCQLA